ncbi:MAG TPA: hypothetical protein PKY59_13960 [Pyrinomonadaceae bacterium]|nr:hypothetical protein [Pyrinomonadaceae bacterium]
MKTLAFIFSIFIFSSVVSAQKKQAQIWSIPNAPNKTATVEGSLKDGEKLTDLSWAWNSSNACFPATQKDKFTGNHVFFVTELPARSIMTVTVKPKKNGVNLSVYAYQISPAKVILPKDLQSCVTCEADHKWDYPKRGRTQGDERTLTFNSTDNSYKIFIGVAGADGLTEGDFTVSVTLKQ